MQFSSFPLRSRMGGEFGKAGVLEPAERQAGLASAME